MFSQAALAKRKFPDRQNKIAIDRSALFDMPLAEFVVPMAPPRYNPRNHAYLACFVYPSFIVKELDFGEKGAEILSIAPRPASLSPPECSTRSLPGETVIKNAFGRHWSGYFKGVKGRFALVDSSDSMNGGLGFGVVNMQTGATIFTDIASVNDGFSKVELVGATLTLDYRRALSPGCSLMTDPAVCWRKIAGATKLTRDPPDCASAYARSYPAQGEANATGSRSAQIQALNEDPSVITYSVRATVGEELGRLKPRPGVVSCSMAE
jgi:hypothetical protein